MAECIDEQRSPPAIERGIPRFFSRFSSEQGLLDQLFWLAFYICIGVLPPLIGVLGHKALSLPMLFISGLVVTRFLMRGECRRRMIAMRDSANVLLLFLLTLLVAVHAVMGVSTSLDNARILTKPVTVFLAATLLIFVWSHRDLVRVKLLLRMSLFGVGAGLLITIIKLVYMHAFLGVGYRVKPHSLITQLMHIHDSINNELKILTILVFVAVCGIYSLKKRNIVLAVLFVILLIVSTYTIGFYDKSGIIIEQYSETIQFGIPLILLVYVVAYRFSKLVTDILFGGIFVVLFGAPWIFQLWFRFVEIVPLPRAINFRIRGEIWDSVGKKILEAPFFGFGIDSSRYLKHLQLHHKYFPWENAHHPHSMILQLWLDLGLVGVMIVAGLLYSGWKLVRRVEPLARPPILAGISMLFVFVTVTHSIWQTWSIMLIVCFIVLIFVHANENVK